jgi:S1-C subfamily serine protease
MNIWSCLGWVWLCALITSGLPTFSQGVPASQSASPSAEEVTSRVSPSVVLILVGERGASASGLGSGLIVEPEGIILTAYHVVKDAKQVQVRLKNGEIFDDVELLGFDGRRDIAALRITAHALPTLPMAKMNEAKAGETVYVVSHAGTLSWTVSSGILSAVRLADEVPGAGSGYRLLQFTAPVSPGSSGGALVDAQGNAMGIVAGSLEAQQNLNFAVPIESVMGLTRSKEAKPYGSGSVLKLPENPKPEAAPSPVAAAPPVASPSQTETNAAPTPVKSVYQSPSEIALSAKTLYIRPKVGNSWTGFPAEPLEKKLYENKEFLAMGLVTVTDPSAADLVIQLDRVGVSWDCTYRMIHPATGAVLGAGKTIAWDCVRAAPGIADQIVKRLKQLRESGTPAPTPPKR